MPNKFLQAKDLTKGEFWMIVVTAVLFVLLCIGARG